MASPICKLGAPIGPRLMHSPGPLRGPSFYAHGAASAFCSSGARPFNRDKDRQDATLLILDCRLLPPNNRLLFTPVPQPICLPCPTAFFICGRWDPATDGTLRKRHGKRENLFAAHLQWCLNGSASTQHVACSVHCTQHRHAHRSSTVHRTGRAVCSARYVGRPTPCLSRPHRSTRSVGCQVGFYDSSQQSTCSLRGSLSDHRSEPASPAPEPPLHVT